MTGISIHKMKNSTGKQKITPVLDSVSNHETNSKHDKAIIMPLP